MTAFEFVVASLAVWRICHLFSKEDGPGEVFLRIRILLGAYHTENEGWVSDKFLGQLILCPLCLSLWVAVIPALYFNSNIGDFVMFWLGISGVTCFIQLRVPEQ